jgi:hypothetical protein
VLQRQEHLYFAAGSCALLTCRNGSYTLPLSQKSARKHTCVIDNKAISRTHTCGKFAEGGVLPSLCTAVEHQHTGLVSFRQGRLGNQFVREMEMEVRDEHQEQAEKLLPGIFPCALPTGVLLGFLLIHTLTIVVFVCVRVLA